MIPEHGHNGRQLQCLGNRPQDHRDRDLLLASLLRDPRLPMFRRHCWKPPAWAAPVPDTVSPKLRRQAQQMIILESLQARFIDKMRTENCAYGFEEAQISRMLDALAACPPRGALYRQDGENVRSCGYAKLCPWCHARRVQELYQTLQDGPCRPESLSNTWLMAGRLSIPVERRIDHRSDEGPLNASGVRSEHTYYGKFLRRLAGQLGIVGGVLIFQVTPNLTYHAERYRKRGYSYEFSIVGEMPGLAGPIDRVKQLTGMDPKDLYDPYDDEEFTFFGPAMWAMLPGGNPQSLRYLLFGSSYKYPVGSLGGHVSKDWPTNYGLQGAAALQPWFLFKPWQAWEYFEATRGIRLYDLWGSWKRRRARPSVSTRRPTSLPTQDGRRGEIRRRRAFQQENQDRQEQALTRREDLLEVATAAYDRLTTELGRKPGSPALRQALVEEGHAVTDREARWLVSRIGQTRNDG